MHMQNLESFECVVLGAYIIDAVCVQIACLLVFSGLEVR